MVHRIKLDMITRVILSGMFPAASASALYTMMYVPVFAVSTLDAFEDAIPLYAGSLSETFAIVSVHNLIYRYCDVGKTYES